MSKHLSIGILLGMFTGGALAALPAFEDVDANGDGAISKQEAAMVEGLDFTRADTNQDGKLSREEYKAATKS